MAFKDQPVNKTVDVKVERMHDRHDMLKYMAQINIKEGLSSRSRVLILKLNNLTKSKISMDLGEGNIIEVERPETPELDRQHKEAGLDREFYEISIKTYKNKFMARIGRSINPNPEIHSLMHSPNMDLQEEVKGFIIKSLTEPHRTALTEV